MEAQMATVDEKLAELLETIHAEKDQVAAILANLEQLKADLEADKLSAQRGAELLSGAVEPLSHEEVFGRPLVG